MTLVVEDGSGLSTAESYISVSDAETRLGNLGDTTFVASTTAEKEQALRKATEYLEQRFRQSWKGTKLTKAQALSWPRYGAIVDGWDVDSDIVPSAIANATADLALTSLTETLNPDTTRAVIREKVGPLETEYSEFSPQSTQRVSINQALAPYIRGGGGNVWLMRA